MSNEYALLQARHKIASLNDNLRSVEIDIIFEREEVSILEEKRTDIIKDIAEVKKAILILEQDGEE